MELDSVSCDNESSIDFFSFGNLQRKPDIYDLDTGTYETMPVFRRNVAAAVLTWRDDRLRPTCTCPSIDVREDTAVAITHVSLCEGESETDGVSDMPSRPIGHPIKDITLSPSLEHARTKCPLDTDIRFGICDTPNSTHSWFDPVSTASQNGCLNNSACDSSSTDKRISGTSITTNALPEVETSKFVGSSTPDSIPAANIPKPEHCSYVGLFNARRNIGEHMKSQHSSDDTSVRPRDIISETGKETYSTVTPTHAHTHPGYATMFQQELKERQAALRRVSTESPRGRYSEWSEFTTPSPPRESYGVTYSEQFVKRHAKSNKKQSSPKPEISCGYDLSPRSLRKMWTSGNVEEEEEGLPSPIGNLNRVNVHPVSDSATGSKHRDLQLHSGSRNSSINKLRPAKESKKKHIALHPFCPDTELVRIYGGTKQTVCSMRKSQRKKQIQHHFNAKSNDSSRGRNTHTCESDILDWGVTHSPTSSGVRRDKTDACTTCNLETHFPDTNAPVKVQYCRDMLKTDKIAKEKGKHCMVEATPNDHGHTRGGIRSIKRHVRSVFRCAMNGRHGILSPLSSLSAQESQVPRDPNTAPDIDTPMSTDVTGILKCQNEKARRNEPPPAEFCPDNVTTRKVRFTCPQRDVRLACNSRAEIRLPYGYRYILDKRYETLESETMYGAYSTPVYHTNIRPKELKHTSFTQSHNIEKEHYLRPPCSTITSSLPFRDMAIIERSLPIIQHFRNVGDYDDLYPGNGEATRWNDICIDRGTLETRAALTSTGVENTSGSMANNSQPFVQTTFQQENHKAYTCTSGNCTRQSNCLMTDTLSSGNTESAWSAISDGSSEESEDGRASGDGYTTLGIVNPNSRVTAEHGASVHSGRSYEDGMRRSQYSYLQSNNSDKQANIHTERDRNAPVSQEFRNTSLETSQRQQTAVENLERALQHGVMHSCSANVPIGYKGGTTLRNNRNSNTECHVDVIDRKALEERVRTPRREVPPPPRVSYRGLYDNASKNNSSVWSVDQGLPYHADHTHTLTISRPLLSHSTQSKQLTFEKQKVIIQHDIWRKNNLVPS